MNDHNQAHALIASLAGNIESRVRFLNKLRDVIARRAPKNKAGAPMISDFDMINASSEELIEAASHARGA
jgi:hypothetical protein